MVAHKRLRVILKKELVKMTKPGRPASRVGTEPYKQYTPFGAQGRFMAVSWDNGTSGDILAENLEFENE